MTDLRAEFSHVEERGGAEDAKLSHATHIIQLTGLLLVVLIVWAVFARLDEVSTGEGKVVPTTREQIIQSLEGGILAKLHVGPDQIVEAGEILAQLDPTRIESDREESASRYRAALASAARLQAEVSGGELTFPDELDEYPELIKAETDLYRARRSNLEQTISWLRESISLVRSELAINESLTAVGAASNIEVIRLKRQLAELQLKEVETESQYLVAARQELATANSDVEALSSTVRGRTDTLDRLTIRSPVRGVVKNIEVTTINGVIPPNGKLMDIVPLDDKLLIETRVSPRDVAFIHVGQDARVKVTAYDYAIYGSLKGKVTSVSADTIQDERDPKQNYYRVFVETDSEALQNKEGVQFPITPGMIASVDIHTGAKTVFDYLIKPFNKVNEALRER